MLVRLDDGFVELPSFAGDLERAIGAVNAAAQTRWSALLIRPLNEPEPVRGVGSDPSRRPDFGHQMGLLRKVLGDSFEVKLTRRLWADLREECVDNSRVR